MNGCQVTCITREDKIFYRIFIHLIHKFAFSLIDTLNNGWLTQGRVEKYRNIIR